MVVPSCLRILRLKPQRPYTDLGRLSTEVGWKYGNSVATLEARRKVKAQAWYDRKKKLDQFKRQAVAQSQAALQKQNAVLAPLRA
jgi:large subunit ribosomal protein L13Ae